MDKRNELCAFQIMLNKSQIQQLAYLKLVIVLGSVGKILFFCFMAIHTDTNRSHFKQAACTINNMNPIENNSFYYVALKSRQYFWLCVFVFVRFFSAICRNE